MSCRKESEVVWLEGLCTMRLERIAVIWQDYCEARCDEWLARNYSYIRELDEEAHAMYVFEHKYWIPWREQVRALYLKLEGMIKDWVAGDIVTPADWHAATAGTERKAICIVSASIPKRHWPLPVREEFPNVIALLSHLEQERIRVEQEEQHTAAMGNIANGVAFPPELKRLRAHYKEQYREIVKYFAQQPADIMDLKCHTGNTLDEVGWQTTVTLKQTEIVRDRTGKVLSDDINSEDERVLPNEPTLDQFGMDLEEEIDYEGEFFLPFDT